MTNDLHWSMQLRKRLLIPGTWRWNAWVRDITARLEAKPKPIKPTRPGTRRGY